MITPKAGMGQGGEVLKAITAGAPLDAPVTLRASAFVEDTDHESLPSMAELTRSLEARRAENITLLKAGIARAQEALDLITQIDL